MTKQKKGKKQNKNKKQRKTVSAPVSIQRTGPVAGVPRYTTTAGGGMRVRHREYITDVLSAPIVNGAFTAQLFPINPGVATTFPWLSAVASRFEKYKFRKLRFCFETTQSSTTVGSSMSAIDFDAADAAPINKQTMMAYAGAQRSPVWNSNTTVAPKKILDQAIWRFTRTGALGPRLDIKTYDLGNFIWASQGIPSLNAALGEIYVEYDVELDVPQLDPNALILANSAAISSSPVGAGAVPLNAAVVSGGLPVSVPSNVQFIISKLGQYIMEMDWTGTGLTTGNYAVTPNDPSNTSLLNAFLADATSPTTNKTQQYKLSVNNVPATFTVNPVFGGGENVTHLNTAFAPFASSLAF